MTAAKEILNGRFFDMTATDDMKAAVLLVLGYEAEAIEFDAAA